MSADHLQAMATAYDVAIEDAGVAVSHNPYQQLIDDRRAFVREIISDAFGSICNEDGDDALTDEVLDEILDAHTDWLNRGDAR